MTEILPPNMPEDDMINEALKYINELKVMFQEVYLESLSLSDYSEIAIPGTSYLIDRLSSFTFLWRAKKSNKRNPPCDCGQLPEPGGCRGAGKNSLNAVVCRYWCFDIVCRDRRVQWP